MKINEWQYLGDGVYAMNDGDGVWLHANDSVNPTDRIYLESSVINALLCLIDWDGKVDNGVTK